MAAVAAGPSRSVGEGRVRVEKGDGTLVPLPRCTSSCQSNSTVAGLEGSKQAPWGQAC